MFQPYSTALQFLRDGQNQDGGWGYLVGQASMVEPTAAVCLALESLPQADDLRQRALAWLVMTQNDDGGWGVSAQDSESGWQTAWATLALARAGELAPAAVARATEWLLAVPILQGNGDENDALGLGIDSALRGWPFLPGQAVWIEPTALALLALSAAGFGHSLPRIDAGIRCILNRRCRGGGWNVGNPYLLGAALPARAEPTALALLALKRVTPDSIEAGDVATLRRDMVTERGALGLALGSIALQALGEDSSQGRALLGERQLPDGSWGANIFHTAAALLATVADLQARPA